MALVLFYDTNGVPQPVDVSDGAVHVLLSDAEGGAIRIDSVTNTLQTIDYSHHEVHAGSHFMYTDSVTLGNGGTQDYMIVTPNTTKWAHMTFYLDGSAITQWQLYEASDKNGTTEQTVGNNNRNSTTVNTTKVYKGTNGGSTDGTLVYQPVKP